MEHLTKWITVKVIVYGFLMAGMIIMAGCQAPGVTVNKNIYISHAENITVKYTTDAKIDSDADVAQDIKGDFKIPLIP